MFLSVIGGSFCGFGCIFHIYGAIDAYFIAEKLRNGDIIDQWEFSHDRRTLIAFLTPFVILAVLYLFFWLIVIVFQSVDVTMEW